MNPFDYVRAENAGQAVLTADKHPRARYIAGGTNLLDFMKESVETPDLIIDINALPYRSIERRGERLYIGALARMSDVAADATVQSLFPVVSEALLESASPQLRHMASIGGNVLQHTRCQYFRDVTQPCNRRRPGSGCGAIGGTNRKEAVLGTSDRCIATHPSDLAVALAALDAQVHTLSQSGERTISFTEFYPLPGDTPQIEHALAPGELITAVSLPLLPSAERSTYVKVRDRMQFEFALASAAVSLESSGGTIRNARIALGGIATIPWRARQAEAAVNGAAPSRDLFVRAADTELAQARGYGENDFKVPLAKRVLIRALEIATA